MSCGNLELYNIQFMYHAHLFVLLHCSEVKMDGAYFLLMNARLHVQCSGNK